MFIECSDIAYPQQPSNSIRPCQSATSKNDGIELTAGLIDKITKDKTVWLVCFLLQRVESGIALTMPSCSLEKHRREQ